MADCMTTVEFLSEWQRMCDTVKICMRCDIPVDSITGASCIQFVRKNRETAIRIVQKWSDEHPLPKPKTYADVFFEKFPNALKDVSGDPLGVCRYAVFDHSGCEYKKPDCMMCWNEPYPEQEVSNG